MTTPRQSIFSNIDMTDFCSMDTIFANLKALMRYK